MTLSGTLRGKYRVKVKSVSRRNTQAVNSPWYHVQNTLNDVLMCARYFPVLLDFNLQISLELDMEILLTHFQNWYLQLPANKNTN